MPEVVYYVAMSLDGYIATSDGGIEWLSAFEDTDEDYGYAAFYATVDAVLLGRRTYEQCLTFDAWPYPGKPCWVFSHGNITTAEPGVTSTNRGPFEVAGEMQAQGLRRAWLVGGGMLAGSFRDAGLITEYIVSIIPIVLGTGMPLFAAGPAQERLIQVGATSYRNGVVQLKYRRGAGG